MSVRRPPRNSVSQSLSPFYIQGSIPTSASASPSLPRSSMSFAYLNLVISFLTLSQTSFNVVSFKPLVVCNGARARAAVGLTGDRRGPCASSAVLRHIHQHIPSASPNPIHFSASNQCAHSIFCVPLHPVDSNHPTSSLITSPTIYPRASPSKIPPPSAP